MRIMKQISDTDLFNEQVYETNSLRENLLTMVGLSKSGYLEVKQPSNIKGRKLKTWKKKWVVVHKMTDLATGTFAAKFYLYSDKEGSKQSPNDKQAFIFDHVTSVESAKSKTHPLAFQIVQDAPALALSGLTEKDTNDWMTSLKELFWPEENKPEGDTFRVTVEQNEGAETWSLHGDYWLHVSPEIITIKSLEDSSVHEWNLNFIKRFFMDKNDVNILIIETGSISEFGEAHFRFKSTSVPDILNVIKQNIQSAIKLRKQRKATNSESESCAVVQVDARDALHEQSFQSLLHRGNEMEKDNMMCVSPIDDSRLRHNSENSSSSSSDEYNSLNSSSTSHESETEIVSTLKVSKSNGQDIEINIDNRGYSHIQPIKSDSNVDKARSASGCVIADDEYTRSTSVCSCDSGFVQSMTTAESNKDETFKKKHKANNSFDSGVSTSSIKPEISASISGIFVVTESELQEPTNTFVPYSKVIEQKSVQEKTTMSRKISDNGTYASIYWDLETDKVTDSKDTDIQENLYEDLDKYRKNLSKLLGFDPKINPTEVPPSLPDRPSTLPTRRKMRSKSAKRKEKKITLQDVLKTVTRGRTSSVSSTSSSMSESDDDKLNTTISSRKQWPLKKASASGVNDLYSTVPDTGVFTSGRPRARSYEDKSCKRFDSVVSVTKWPMASASNDGVNNITVYDPIYSKVKKNNHDNIRRSLSSVDLMLSEKSRQQQHAMDLLTGDTTSHDNLFKQADDILTPVSVTKEELDFIDFSTEILVPELDFDKEHCENSDRVWNPFPKIADFSSNIQPEVEESTENLIELNSSDPFDIFHIGVMSSRLGLSNDNSVVQDSSILTDVSDLDKTIKNQNEEIYMEMGDQTIHYEQKEQTVEYVLPTDVLRT